MEKSILLVGGGGHCCSVLDSLCLLDEYDRIGIVARDEENLKELKKDRLISNYLVGVDEELPMLFANGWNYAFVTLGSIGNPIARKKIYSLVKQIGFVVPTIIDRFAVVSKKANIEEGVFIGKNAVVNVGSSIGSCCIINTGCIVEHGWKRCSKGYPRKRESVWESMQGGGVNGSIHHS